MQIRQLVELASVRSQLMRCPATTRAFCWLARCVDRLAKLRSYRSGHSFACSRR
jgi:hypothetical protein